MTVESNTTNEAIWITKEDETLDDQPRQGSKAKIKTIYFIKSI